MANDRIDTRVVRMEFDNKQFEKNVKQTSKSLDNLKQKLDFKGVGNSIDEVRVKISALQVVATTFIAKLTNRLIDLGVTLVKSLSVDNISSGWTKFSEKTTSVATMMAQKIRIAGKEITDLAEKTAIVNEQLELLTWFSDETSYSFTDMVNNIGKFTAAGQDLDVSVKAMEGIATWAALSGQNAQTASRAMYQLAQAMGKGKIQRIDWMSIQNANMDTEEFRETILATAVSIGQLTKEGENFITKTGKKFTQSQFTEFLSEGWFTSEVLVKGLEKYSSAIDEIYEISQREGITASEVIEKYGDTLDKFGVKAFKAAQEARTFVDVLNSVKDAVSSKWMTTFENIFGGQEEAVKLWTELANELYDAFAESGNFRNNILSVWKNMGGRDDIFGEHGSSNQGAFWNLYDAIISIRDLIKKAWNTVFPLSTLESESDQVDDIARKLKDLTKRIKDFTANLKSSETTANRISNIFKILFSLLKGFLTTLKAIRFILDPIIELGKTLVGQILDKIVYYINKILENGIKLESFIVKLQNNIANIIDVLNPSGILEDVITFIEDIFKILSDLHPLQSITNFIEEFIESFVKAGGTQENFKKIIKSVIKVINLLKKAILDILSVLIKNLMPIIDKILDAVAKVIGFITGTVVKIIAVIADVISAIVDAIQGNGDVSEISESIYNIFKSLGDVAKSTIPVIASLLKILKSLIDIVLLIPDMLNQLSKKLTGRGIVDNLVLLFDNISDAINNFIKGIKVNSGTGSIQGLFNAISIFFEGLYEFLKGLIATAQLLITALGASLKVIGKALQYIADIFIKVFTGKFGELTKAEQAGVKIVGVLAAITGIVFLLYLILYRLLALINPIGVVADSLSGVLDSFAHSLLAMTIRQFADSFLEIVIALTILTALDKKVFMALGILAGFVATIAALIILIKNMSSALTDVKNATKEVKEKVGSKKGYNRVLKDLAILLHTIGSLFLKIAIAMLIFNKISWGAWGRGMLTLGIIATMIIALAIALNKFGDSKLLKKGNKDTGKSLKELMLSFGIFTLGVKILANALTKIGSISIPDLAKGLAVFTVITGIFSAIVMTIGKNGKGMKKADNILKSMLGFSMALLSVGLSMLILSNLSWEQIGKGLVTTLIALMTFIEVVTAIEINGKGMARANNILKSMLAFSLALMSVAISLGLLSRLSWEQIGKGSLVIGIALSTFMGIAYVINKNGKGMSKANNILKSMIAFSIALTVVALSMLVLSNLSWEQIGKGSLVIGIALSTFMGIAYVINKNGKGMSKANNILKSMIAFSLILLTLAGVFNILKTIETDKLLAIAASIGIILAGLTLLLTALAYMSSMKKTGKSNGIDKFVESFNKLMLPLLKLSLIMLTLSSSMVIFAYGLKQFENIEPKTIITGLLALAGSIVVLGVAAKVLQPVIGVVIGLAAALLMVGLALLTAGLGLITISTGLQGLNNNFAPALETLSGVVASLAEGFITGIINMIPRIIEALGILFESLTGIMPELFGLIGAIIDGILDLLETRGPRIIQTIVNLLTTAIVAINDQIGTISSSLMNIIATILQSLAERAEDIGQSLVDIFIGLVKVLTKNAGPLVAALIDFIKEILIALFENIGPLIDVVADYLFDFIAKLIVVITRKTIAIAAMITKVVLIVIAAVIRLTIASLGALSKLFITFVASILLILVHTFMGLTNALFEVLKVVIKETLKLLVEVIIYFQDIFVAVGKIMVKLILRGIITTIQAIGGWLIDLIDMIFGTNISGKLQEISDKLADEARSIVSNLEGGTDRVQAAISTAANNINDVVSMTADAANEAVVSGMSQISDAVTDSIDQLGSALQQFGEDAGNNLYEGLGSSDNINGANQVGESMGNAAAAGFASATETHSPSRLFARFGQFLMEGLGLGIQNGSTEAENAMAEVISDSLALATDILDSQENDDYTIKVGMDITSVEEQASRIQDVMSGISDPNLTASGRNANYNGRVLERKSDVNSGNPVSNKSTTVTYNNTFNIESTDPQQSAEEIDKVLKEQNTRFKLAHGT